MFKRAASKLYNWVAVMIVLGALLGHFYPAIAVKMQPLADGFINLIKMLIPPVILCTVVLGIAGAGGVRKAGRVGIKALIYFEVVSTFALVLGLLMAHWFGPGRSFHADPSQLDGKLVGLAGWQVENLVVLLLILDGHPAQDAEIVEARRVRLRLSWLLVRASGWGWMRWITTSSRSTSSTRISNVG